ncbi:hypothetical protein SEVIR_8G255400v4 [Setaria viridis]
MDESNIRAAPSCKCSTSKTDLWKWLTGQEQPPEDLNSNPVFTAIKSKVTDNLSKHASPETRSTPGQPWVRGWDDIKKGCSRWRISRHVPTRRSSSASCTMHLPAPAPPRHGGLSGCR